MSTNRRSPIVALPYASAIDDPARFKSSNRQDPFRVDPDKYQSCETDYTAGSHDRRQFRCARCSTRPPHVMCEPVQGLFAMESWGIGSPGAPAMSKANVGPGAQSRGDHASHARRCNTLQRPLQRLTGRVTQFFGRVRHQAFSKRSPFAGTMDQVRPLPTRSLREHANVDGRLPLPTPSGGGPAPDPVQNRARRADNAKGLTNRGPLQKGGQRALRRALIHPDRILKVGHLRFATLRVASLNAS